MSDTVLAGSSPVDTEQLWSAEKAARRFYLDDRSKMQIAAEMGLSRFKVARLLELARSTGMVRITIEGAGDIDGDLSLAVQDRFTLRDVLVVSAPASADDAAMRDLLGATAANLLTSVIGKDDVLGLGWARSVLAMVANLSSLAPCPVVQLSGALTRPDVESDSIGLVRTVARIGGGPAAFFYAPMIAATPGAARAIRAQADVAAARARYDTVTTAVVGVGGWEPAASTLSEALTPSERSVARSHGVYTDLSGVVLDKHGRAVQTPLSNRIIGLNASQLRAIPNVIAIAYGVNKVGAAHAAITGGYVNSLVTHATFARALLHHA